MWCHQNQQLCELRPSFTSERTFGPLVSPLLGGVDIFDLDSWSNNQSRFTRWEKCIMYGLRPFTIILITASLSSKTNKDALWLEM